MSFEDLDRNLDDIEDLPGFDVPPKGTYSLLCNAASKKINDKPAVEFSLEVLNTIELADKTEKQALDGTKFSTLFFVDNDTGLAYLKKFVAPFAQAAGSTNLRVILEAINNVQITATVDHRVDKSTQKVYAQLKNINVS